MSKYILLTILIVFLALNGVEWYNDGTTKAAFFSGTYLILLIWLCSDFKNQ